MKERLPLMIISLVIFIFVVTMSANQERQYRKTIETLTSMNSTYITTFKIYPGVIKPVESSIDFEVPDPIIDDFFHSLNDLRVYRPSHDRVASRNHDWFLEVASKGVQIAFHIPSRNPDSVVGHLGKFTKTQYGMNITHYGDFQSQKLFKWYQKYSHRWLKPEEAHDTQEE